MTYQGKNYLENLRKAVETGLGEKFKPNEFEGTQKEIWFTIGGNHFVHVDKITGGKGCILLEHAESMEQRYLAEDGDLFYPEDFKTDEALIEAILKEIRAGFL